MPAPRSRTPSRPSSSSRRPGPPTSEATLGDDEVAELQALLDAVPAPLQPLDADTLDGFLCGVIVQPQAVPPARWLPYVTDDDGRALPPGFDARRLHALALRRHGELARAITGRAWFDPWLFADAEPEEGDVVYPWVAGFAAALEIFPELMRRGGDALLEPLALLYRHLEVDDLEDADELLALIEASEPVGDLAESAQDLVAATLQIADVAAAMQAPAGGRRPAGQRARRPR